MEQVLWRHHMRDSSKRNTCGAAETDKNIKQTSLSALQQLSLQPFSFFPSSTPFLLRSIRSPQASGFRCFVVVVKPKPIGKCKMFYDMSGKKEVKSGDESAALCKHQRKHAVKLCVLSLLSLSNCELFFCFVLILFCHDDSNQIVKSHKLRLALRVNKGASPTEKPMRQPQLQSSFFMSLNCFDVLMLSQRRSTTDVFHKQVSNSIG